MQKILLTRLTNTSNRSVLKLLLLGLILTFSFNANGQSDLPLAYKGLTIEVDFDESNLKHNCSAIHAIPSEVKRRRDKDCTFAFLFESLGRQKIQLLTEDKMLYDQTFKVVALPEINVVLDGHSSGKIEKQIFLALSELQLLYRLSEIPYDVKIVSFKFTHLRNGEKVFSSLNMRNKYNTAVKNLIKKAESNDEIVIDKIELAIGEFKEFILDKELRFRIQ